MRNATRLLLVCLLTSIFTPNAQSQCNSTVTTFPHHTTFENGLNGWYNEADDQFDWIIDASGTPSANTGPSSAFEGSNYLYTETTTAGTFNCDALGAGDTALFVSPCYTFPTGSAPSISFRYHMYTLSPTEMGSLRVQQRLSTSNSWQTISDTLINNQGNSWQEMNIALDTLAGTTSQIRIMAITGPYNFSDNQGDRAIDDIWVTTGIESTDNECTGDNSGSATANIYYGSGTITYSWSTSATSQTISNLTAGTYTVTVTRNSTNRTLSVEITEPEVPSDPVAAGDTNLCSNNLETVTLSVGFPDKTQTYYYMSEDETTNITSGSINFTADDAPTNPVGDATVRFYYMGDLDDPSSGGGQEEFVELEDEDGNIIGDSLITFCQCYRNFDSTEVIIPLNTLTPWAADGEIDFTGDAQGGVNVGCLGHGVRMRGMLEIEYEYSSFKPYWFTSSCPTSTATAIDSGYSISVNPTTTTTYYVKYFDDGCSASSGCDSVTVTVNSPPSISVSPASPTYCSTPTTLTASGATTYTWSPGTGLNTSTGAVVQASPSNTTTYQVVGLDANSCADTTDVTVTVTSGPSVSIAGTNVDCFGGNDGAATATASNVTGTANFAWSANAGSATTATVTGLTADTYTVTVTDNTTCQAVETVTITQPTDLVVTLSTFNSQCNGGSSGQIQAVPSGGTGSYSYAWSGTSSTSATITNLSAGTYTVTVTDGNNCTETAQSTISQPTAIAGGASVVNNVSCFGGNDGSATTNISGGTPPYTYSWTGGAGNSATATNLTAGTYFIFVQDANNCSYGPLNVTITQPSTAVSVSIGTPTNVSCFGGNDGAATASATGGTGTKTFAWSTNAGSATTAAITGLTADTYTVTATDANGCTDTESVTITQPTAVAATFSNTNVSCFGGSDGASTATGAGGTGTYTGFAWSANAGSATTATVTGLTADTYTVTVTDNNGCTGSTTTTITEPTAVVASIAGTNASCNGTATGSATASATGGTGTKTFAWSTNAGSATTATVTGLTADTYTVTATDANGCTDTETVTITEPTAVVASIGTPTNVSCFGGNDGAATASATGGTGTKTFAWSTNAGSATTATVTGLSADTYTVTATDANGCTDTETVTITEPATAVSASIGTPTNVSCNGGNDGAATASATGGTGTKTFAWSTNAGSATTAAVTGLSADTYTVTATDANGCTDTETVTITEPTAVVASIAGTNASCNGTATGSATASATGGTGTKTFAWSTNAGSATTATVTGLTADTYTVTATDANGCTDTETVTITEPTAVVASIAGTNASCNGTATGSATASATGGTGTKTFAWSTNAGSATTATVTGLTADTYTVTATDANGCTDTETVTITEPTAVVASIGTPTNVSCFGGNDGAATASATGGTGTKTFAWSTNAGSATTATVTGLSADTYTVTATDANGCTDTETVTITEPATAVSASIGTPTNVSCNGGNDGAATASATGGTGTKTFAWSSNAGSATTAAVTGLSADTYTVTATDANGCTDTETVTITEPTAVVASIAGTNASCNGTATGSATASATGGTGTKTFAWSTNAGSATTATVTGLTADTYTVTATDANGCTDTETVTITEPTAVVASIAGTNASCNGTATGSATASATGGTGTKTFAWSTNAGSATTATVTGLTADTYTVTATDANGCTDTETVTITEPTAVVASIGTPTNVSCFGGNDGAATASATGGTGTKTFAWSTNAGSATTATVTGLSADTYTVTATDANGCTDTETVTITEPATAVSASIGTPTNVSCNGGNDGAATASATGGTGTKTFAWSSNAGSATTAAVTGLSADTYTVTATDANGCTDTETVTITEPTAVVASIAGTNASCNGTATGSATASATGGTGTKTFAWSSNAGSATTATVTGLTADTYTVTATDANGCTDTETVTITEPTAVVASIAGTNASCNGTATGSATASATGGTGTKTFAWSTNAGSATTATVTGLTADTYTVTATDANGCTDTETVTITEPTAVVASIGTPTNVSCFGGNDGAATASATGGTGTKTFAWSTNAGSATTATVTGLSADTYTVTATDANGCTDTETVTITEPATAVSASIGTPTNVSCNGGNDGAATASATGGTGTKTFAWSSNAGSATTAAVTGLSADTYTVTATDANGCTDTETVTITEPTAVVASIAGTNASCNGTATGSATASATGGTGTKTFAWSTNAGSATTATVTGLTADTYTVTATDANGCTDTETVTITEPTAVVASIAGTNASCNGTATGSATASATGGTGTKTFAWSTNAGSATTATVTGLTADTYTVTATDANGCTDTETVTITEPTAVVASIGTPTNVSCFGGNDGAATASATGGTGTKTFAWSTNAGSATTATVTGLSADTYTVTATDANGCTDTETVTITEPATAVSASIGTPTNVSCNGGNDGAATASATGGTGTKTFAWSSNAGSATTAAVTGLSADTYTVTATDANGCTDTETVTITEPTAVVASIAGTNASCNGTATGSATASATGGTGTKTFAWSTNAGSATTATVTGLTADTYTVTATDANGCTDTETVTITEPTAVVASIAGTNASCNGTATGSATASATGGTGTKTFAWSTNAGSATTATVTGLTADTYTVTATDANGCTDTETVTITEPTAVVASIGTPTNVSCFGGNDGAATASATGGTGTKTFAWSTNAGSATTATVTGLSADTYTVTATDANGCTDSETVTITEPTQLVSSAVVDDNVSCNGGNDGGATASATGGTGTYSFAWSSNAGSATTAAVTGLSADTYSVTVTDANGCTDSSSVIITEPTLLVSSAVVDDNVSCFGLSDGEATASATGGTGTYSFAWSTNAGSATTANITGLSADTYSVTVTDANGCTDSSSVIITEPTLLVAATALDSNVSCNGLSDGGATASATGGTTNYSFAWSANAGSATTSSVAGLAAGTYSVTVTDANGCTDSASVTITEPTVLAAATSVNNNVSCFGGNDGSATASASGGTPTYSFAWSTNAGGATTANVTGLSADTYTVTATDANGCTDAETVTITEPTQLVSSAVVDDNVSCNGGNDGGATASATGGTGTYSFAWSSNAGSATTAAVTGLSADTYSVTVTDANGCTDSSSVIITEPTLLVSSAVVDDNVSCFGLSDGEATASATGGTGTYSFAWSTNAGSATTANITGLSADTYSVTVTDANGCTDSSSVIITQPALLIAATVVDSNVSCNGLSDGGATASATGGTTNYSFAWSANAGSATTSNVTGLAAGTYSVTVTDANGCADSASVTITEPITLVAAISVDSNVSCNGGFDGGATASATGGTTNYTFVWSTNAGSATTATVTGLSADTYTVTATDANGCTDAETVTITEPTQLVSSAVVDDNVSCNGGNDGGATASATGGTGTYSFAWSSNAGSATTAAVTGLSADTYSVTVTDANGCTDSSSVIITEPTLLVSSAVVDDNVSCFGLSDGEATASATGGTGTYSFAWSTNAGSATTANITGLSADTYSVTVTDANGCTDSSSVTITQPDTISNTMTISNALCNGESNGYLIATAAGGTQPYNYSWNNSATTDSIGGLPAGTYTVTITDINNCDNVFEAVITEPALLVASIVLEDSALCAGDSSGLSVASGIGGTAPYIYSWPTGFNANNDTLFGLPAGLYTVTLTDVNGCIDSATATIAQPQVLTLSIDSLSDVTCEGGNDGYAEIGVNGGTTPYSFSWPNGGTQSMNSTLEAVTHIVTVTDVNGCFDTISVTINSTYSLPVVDLGEDTIVCGATYNLMAGSTTTYLWSTGATTQSILVDSSGYYAVTASDTNGCSNNDSVLVIFNPLLSYSVNTDSSVCATNSGSANVVNLTGGGNYSIDWSSGQTGGLIANNLAAGNYSITISDQNGCSEIQSFTIAELPAFTYTVSASDESCNGAGDGSASVTVSGGTSPYQYLWSNGSSTDSINGLTTGNYLVTIQDANGCLAFDTATINQPGAITISVSSLNSACGDSTGLAIVDNVLPLGSYTYAWDDYLNQTTDTAAQLPSGLYNVTVTDNNGCAASSFVIVNDNGAPSLAMNSLNATCENGNDGLASANPTGTAPFAFSWSDGLSQATDTASALTNGLYFVTVVDANSCARIDSVSVGFDNAAPAISLGPDITDCADSTMLSVGSGFTNYLWSTLETTSGISVNTSGTYAVAVTNAAGCITVDSIDVTLNDPITISSLIDSSNCSTPNGSIDVTVLTGAGQYSFLWSNGNTNALNSGLSGGVYVVTISDTLGCEAIETFVVGTIGAPVVSINVTDANCFGTPTGSADATATGGTAPYSFVWSDGQAGSTANSLTAGTYTVTVSDASACESAQNFIVGSDPAINISITATDPSCGDSNGVLQAIVSGNQGPAAYIWNDINNTDSSYVDSLFAGLYSITVSDSAGCTATSTIALNDSGAAILVLGSTDNVCENENTGTAFVSPFGSGPFSYSWSDTLNQANDTALNLGAGTYSVVVTDVNGCASVGSTTVGFFYNTPIVSLGDDITACEGSEVILTPGGQYDEYLWTGGATTPSITALTSQSYTVDVIDLNGCSGVDTILIDFESAPIVSLGPDTVICSDDGGTSFDLDAGAGFSQYSWSTSETSQSITVSTGGAYRVTVTSIPECTGTDEVIVVFDDCTRLDVENDLDSDSEIGLSIYPNPSLGQFTVETQGLPQGLYSFKLMSLTGQMVFDRAIPVSNNGSRTDFDLHDTDSGVYMIVIENDEIKLDGRLIIQ